MILTKRRSVGTGRIDTPRHWSGRLRHARRWAVRLAVREGDRRCADAGLVVAVGFVGGGFPG